ncbi:MAG: S41 family peptidase [Anaerolineae bacterium]|nr:S41 family peptidase [Anaerolineae bacterium]
MENKSCRSVVLSFIGIIFLLLAFSGGVIVGFGARDIPQLNSLALVFSPNGNPQEGVKGESDLTTLFKPFWETWNLVHVQYVDQPVDNVKMMRGAIRGMLESLGDAHTSYMDPDQYRQQNAPLQGEYEGIGAYVDTTGDFLAIISPMPGSPAEKAGLKAGDQVMAVDKEDMTGVDGELVLKKILGPADTTVVLTIRREGVEDPFDVSIVRSKISLPSVEGKMLDDNIAYVRLATFGEKTDVEFREVLQPLLDKKPDGLILDLRYNGGGFLTTAIEIVSEFIPTDKVVLYEQFGNGDLKNYMSKGKGIATDIPLVILVNEGSASASEITAGAIQDYKRGVLIGVTTYGKGSVQNWVPLSNEQGAVRVTIARWLTPEKRQINKVGLTPDVKVEISEEDIKNEHDAQLEAAIDYLLKK